jgi:vacuolar-type H+-ATPase subunit E/Vma4
VKDCKTSDSRITEVIDNEYEKISSGNSENEDVIYGLYLKSIPLIKSIAKRYVKLDIANDQEDFLNEGYMAVESALRNYRKDSNKDSDMKFSTFLTWCLQKNFEKICPSDDKLVEINGNGKPAVVSYKDFQKVKKKLKESEGTTWTVFSRFIPFEPFQNTNGNPNGVKEK